MADLDELLKLLVEEESVERDEPVRQGSTNNKDVHKFIKKTGLKPGDKKVPTYVIYYHFIKWCQPNFTKLWGKEEFFRTFKQHFQLKRSGHQRYYMINDALDLSDELYEKAKKYDFKWQKRGKLKKK